MRLILRLLANAAALAVATFLLDGISLTAPTTEGKVVTLLVLALIFGLVNAFVKPIFTLVTVPLQLLTLGPFLLVINALMLLLTSWVSTRVDLGWSGAGFGGGWRRRRAGRDHRLDRQLRAQRLRAGPPREPSACLSPIPAPSGSSSSAGATSAAPRSPSGSRSRRRPSRA